MSDPVTNVEVEDVLSSIRRLVSDDKRPILAVQAAPANDRLVLTPALRVAESGDQAADQLGNDVPEIDSVETPVVQAWSEFGTPQDESDKAEVSQQSSDSDVLDSLLEPDNAEGGDPVMEALEAQIEALDDDHAGDDYLKDRDADENHAVDTEAVVGEAEAPFILENVVGSALNVPEVDAAQDKNTDLEISDISEAELVEEDSEAAFFASSAATLSAKIAALETAIGKTEDQWEPDDTGTSDYSGTEAPTMNWEEASAEDVEIAADEADKAHASEAKGGFSQSVEDLLDEDALRDIVSDIVREELQGALGERITRNVRKLVRREIHRALAAQELE